MREYYGRFFKLYHYDGYKIWFIEEEGKSETIKDEDLDKLRRFDI